MSGNPANSTVSYEQLIALNDEVLAIARSGVPLEKGLAYLGGDLPGNLGATLTDVSARLAAGEGLSSAMSNATGNLPPAYAAVIDAGLKSGKLTSALEGMADTLRRIASVRRTIGLALIYPILVLVVGGILFCLSVPSAMRQIQIGAESARIAQPTFAITTAYFVTPFMYALPPIALALAITWWIRSRRAVYSGNRELAGIGYVLPNTRQMMSASYAATFLELLSLQLRHRVPLTNALRTAGAASGSRQVNASAVALAEAFGRGEIPDANDKKFGGIPQTSVWAISRCVSRNSLGNLPDVLSRLATGQRQRAEQLAEWTGRFLPVILVLVIGLILACTNALLVVSAWSDFCHSIAWL